MNLEWRDIELTSITKAAWNQRIERANSLQQNATKLMLEIIDPRGRYKLSLCSAYDRYMKEYGNILSELSLVAPEYVTSFRDYVKERGALLAEKADKLFTALEKSSSDALVQQYVESLARYNVADDMFTMLANFGILTRVQKQHTADFSQLCEVSYADEEVVSYTKQEEPAHTDTVPKVKAKPEKDKAPEEKPQLKLFE